MARNLLTLIGAVLVCQVIGNVGTLFTLSAIPTWYASLNKPFFTPPNWLFAPVWLTLYTLMGIALYLVFNNKKNNGRALVLFAMQLILNALWSILFFGMRSVMLGLVCIFVLWLAIYATTIEFGKVDKMARNLMLPYIAWVSLALLLNLGVFLLN